ncbi:MAG: hypothetical protein ACREDW_09660 [Aestuariivirgaceae bacterium]
MKINARDRQILRQAAAVMDAQEELVALQKDRKEGRPLGASAAGPVFALILASMAMVYFSVLAITSERDTGTQPVFVSGDIEPTLTRG